MSQASIGFFIFIILLGGIIRLFYPPKEEELFDIEDYIKRKEKLYQEEATEYEIRIDKKTGKRILIEKRKK